jgi:hypothetical protein
MSEQSFVTLTQAIGDKLLDQIICLYPEVRTSSKILNIALSEGNGNYLEEVSNPVFFLRFIDSLLDCIKSMERGGHLIIVGFPLLSRKFVGLLVLFGQNFEEIGFVRPLDGRDAIFFSEFRGLDAVIDASINDVRRASMRETVSVEKVVEVLPISKLTARPFYDLLFAHNTNVLRSKGLKLLSQVEVCNSESDDVE